MYFHGNCQRRWEVENILKSSSKLQRLTRLQLLSREEILRVVTNGDWSGQQLKPSTADRFIVVSNLLNTFLASPSHC